jgi:hypothetical protein
MVERWISPPQDDLQNPIGREVVTLAQGVNQIPDGVDNEALQLRRAVGVYHGVAEAGGDVLTAGKLRVHRPLRPDGLAGRRGDQVGGNPGAAQVDGDAVEVLRRVAGLDVNQLRAVDDLLDPSLDLFLGAKVEERRLQVAEEAEVGSQDPLRLDIVGPFIEVEVAGLGRQVFEAGEHRGPIGVEVVLEPVAGLDGGGSTVHDERNPISTRSNPPGLWKPYSKASSALFGSIRKASMLISTSWA